jgi:diguanylate cyclase (GGDEF)-like protein
MRRGDKKHGWAIVVCKMDIDFFKTINDGFGYTQMGDFVLKEVARILKTSLRKGGDDIVFRLGGDEFFFALSIYDNDTEKITPTLNRLIKAIRMGSYGKLNDKEWVIGKLGVIKKLWEEKKINQADIIKTYESLLLQLFLQNPGKSMDELREELTDFPTAFKAAEGEEINGHTYTFERWKITPSVGAWKAKKGASTQGEDKKEISAAWVTWFLNRALDQKIDDNLNKAKNQGRNGFVMTTGDIGPYLEKLDEFQKMPQEEMGSADDAMQALEKGGIDLTPANMNIQVKTGSPTNTFGDDSRGIKFHLDPAMLAQLQNAPGFVPVIINVQPLNDLKSFLGIVNQT